MTWLTNPYRFGGGLVGEPVGARLHWRVMLMASPTGAYEINEIELAATPGGADQCSGGTATTNELTGASNAFDNNDSFSASFVWTIFTPPLDGIWLAYEFPAPVSVRELRLRSTSGFPERAPTALVLQASDDGSTWRTVDFLVEPTTYTALQTKTFAVSPVYPELLRENARAWRINVSANNGGGNTAVGELEFRATSGGASLCTGGVGMASKGPSTPTTYAAAFDGASSPKFMAGGVWRLWYNFPAIADPAYVAVRAPHEFADSDSPRDFTVQWTVDGETWTTAATITGQTGWTNSQIREFAL